MRGSCGGLRHISKTIRSRQGWPLHLMPGHGQAQRQVQQRQAQACPTRPQRPPKEKFRPCHAQTAGLHAPSGPEAIWEVAVWSRSPDASGNRRYFNAYARARGSAPQLKGSLRSRHHGGEVPMKRLLLPVILAAALPAAESPVAPAVNAFTTAAYQQLSARDANLILSPFNIWTTLSMALAGARGQTAAEIQSVLHLRADSSADSGHDA